MTPCWRWIEKFNGNMLAIFLYATASPPTCLPRNRTQGFYHADQGFSIQKYIKGSSNDDNNSVHCANNFVSNRTQQLNNMNNGNLTQFNSFIVPFIELVCWQYSLINAMITVFIWLQPLVNFLGGRVGLEAGMTILLQLNLSNFVFWLVAREFGKLNQICPFHTNSTVLCQAIPDYPRRK